MSTPMDDVEFAETLLTLFDCSPDDFAWRHPVCDQIEARRAQMNDRLIFDVLLSMGGILHPDRLYPPNDVDSLKLLLDAIRHSTYDTLKKDCLIYYLLKWHEDGREEVYRDEKSIPPQFVLLADAYWYLDTGLDVAKAVSILSDVRLNRDYPSKILQAISLSKEATPLILKYVRTAKPILTEPVDIDIYTMALAESSLLEAWQYQRTYPEASESRPRLLRKILEWCLSPHPRPEPLTQLLGFPFSNYEQTLIHKYALQPPSTLPPSSVPIIQDLVCVRLIQSGQYAAAIKLDRRFAASIIPGTTSKMQKAIQDRRKMMDEILATLPAVERNLVEAELEAGATDSAAPETSFFAKGKAHADRSWEEIKSPFAAVNGSADHTNSAQKDLPQFGASPIVPISARNDMPRFGAPVSQPSDPVSGNTFIPISTSTSALSQVRQTHQSPFTPRSSHVLPLSSSQNSRTPAPLLGSSGIKYPAPLFTQSSTPSAKPASSLFKLAGSANQTRNAFYTPPVTNGIKRPLGDDEPRPTIEASPAPNVADEPPAPSANGDVDMESDEDFAVSNRVTEAPPAKETETAAPSEFSYSVFGNKSSIKQPSFKTRRITRAETEMKMPPGAYVPDEEELAATTTSQYQDHRHPSLSPSPPPPVKQTRSSRSRSRKPERAKDLKRSLPGAFVSEEDNEEEDYVAPLPTSPPRKRPTRKRHSSRSVGSEDEESHSAKPTRRSMRLTAASSVASTSPEPPSPRKAAGKAKKSTRTSGKTGSKSGSRKK